MDLLSFPHSASLVTKANKELYDAVPASSPITLTGTAPATSFRCRATVTSTAGHTDCAGSLTIGTETLTFSASGQKKTTTVSLSSLPVVSYVGLDCQITIECITVSGADIQTETLTSVQIRYEPTSKMFMSPEGSWTQSSSYAMIVNSTVNVGSTIRYNSTDYTVKQVEAFPWIDGTEVYRILYF